MPAQGSTHSCPDSEWRGLKRRKRRLRGVIEMFLQRYLDDIRVKTAGMTAREKISYVFTYYWYHMLIMAAIIALILFAVRFYVFGNRRPEFTCVLVDQEINDGRDAEIVQAFAKENDLDPDLVTVDSDYVFSYGDVQLQGVNESSYDKFFLKWRNKELDAVILSESMYQYCREMRGEFRSLENMDTSGFETYTDGNEVTAVVLGKDEFMEAATGKTDEKLLLAFPDNGRHADLCDDFLQCIREFKGELGGQE